MLRRAPECRVRRAGFTSHARGADSEPLDRVAGSRSACPRLVSSGDDFE